MSGRPLPAVARVFPVKWLRARVCLVYALVVLAYFSSLRGVALLRKLHHSLGSEPPPLAPLLPETLPSSRSLHPTKSVIASNSPGVHQAAAEAGSNAERNVSVLSYSVFGNDPKYLVPLLFNVRRYVPRYYPGWQVRVYHDASVPNDFLGRLRRAGADAGVDVRLVNVSDPHGDTLLDESWSPWLGSLNPMTWRLLVASDPTVDAYVVRDSDSVPNARERAAVDEWLSAPGAPAFHLMHDHPRHFSWQGVNVTMLGCCWGGRGGRAAPNMAELLRASYYGRRRKQRRADGTFVYGDDQDFLDEMVYPSVLSLGPGGSVRHNSFDCDKNDGMAFPTAGEWDIVGYDFVGEVVEMMWQNWTAEGNGNGDVYDIAGWTMRGRDNAGSGACWLHFLMRVGSSWRKRFRKCLRRRVEHHSFRNATDITGWTPPPAPKGCKQWGGSMSNKEKLVGGDRLARRVHKAP